MFVEASRRMPDPAGVIELLRHPEPLVRGAAARWLRRARHSPWRPAAVDGLVQALADEDPGVRRGAMHTLERLGEGGLVSMVREIWRGNRFVALLVCDARLVAPARTALILGPAPARCA